MAFREYCDWIYEKCKSGKGCVIITYTGNDKDVIVPNNIDGHPVMEIGCGISPIFYSDNQDKVERIILQNSVETIADCAFFMCVALKEIVLPTSIKTIGRQAFSGCTSLTSIEIPLGVEEIDQNTFFGCIALYTVIMPSTIKTIADRAFLMCENLESVVIPKSIESIGVYSFKGTKLKNINLPSTVTYVSQEAFNDDVNIFKSRSKNGGDWYENP